MFRILLALFFLTSSLSAKQITFASDTIPCDPSVKVPKTFCPTCEVWNDHFSPDFTDKLPVEYHLSIYNKDSVEVFSTVDIDKGWSGTGKDNYEQTQSFRWEMSYRYEKDGTLYWCTDNLVLLQ
ncbi:MAG: gliding motility-associated C-terminal domain-containing protein [Bacteroidota bacterium]|nr:gliding motility-associated C-terminal domain-containing protein [Bacteroidota bacterium]